MDAEVGSRTPSHLTLDDLRILGIRSLPINPFKVIVDNGWQIATYPIMSALLGMSVEKMKSEISNAAFTFYSFYYHTYVIVYNDNLPYEKVVYSLSHEIGHIYYSHVSPNCTQNFLLPKRQRKIQEKTANEFAEFVLADKNTLDVKQLRKE